MPRKVIITCSLTGVSRPKPLIRIYRSSRKKSLQQAYECFNEGCAIAHLHARDKEGKPTGEPAVFREIHSAIRAKCNMILQDSTGGGPNLS